MQEEEKLRKYDQICQETILTIFSLSQNTNTISFTNFDIENKDHWFVLYIANIVSGLTKKDIKINSGFWVRRKFKKQTGKTFGMLEKPGEEDLCIDIEELLQRIYPICKEIYGEDFSFTEIYKEYYLDK